MRLFSQCGAVFFFSRCVVIGAAVAAIMLRVGPVSAQVFDAGPSDPALFDVVINLPPSTSGDVGDEVGGDGQTTQLNFDGGGLAGSLFDALEGAEVNIRSGSLDVIFDAHAGSEVNISGGVIDGAFDAFSGSWVSLRGGAIGAEFRADVGSDVDLIGGEFRLNGAPYTASTITLASDDVLTGTLEDGSSFVFAYEADDRLVAVDLVSSVLPPKDETPQVLNGVVTSGPSGLRPGQSLTVQEGGELLGGYAVVDATLNVEGGVVGDRAAFSGAIVNVTNGGRIGASADAFTGSEIDLIDGSVDRGFTLHSGAVMNQSGGSLDSMMVDGGVLNIDGGFAGSYLQARGGGVINLRGGSVGVSFWVDQHSVANISGGFIGDGFIARQNSTVNITGGEFQGSFAIWTGSVVTLSNARLGDSVVADRGGALTIGREGAVGERFEAYEDAVVTINGGAIGDDFNARPGSVVNLTSGSIGNDFDLYSGAEINIRGGAIGTDFEAYPESVVNLYGVEFLINGALVDELIWGETHTFTERDVTLSGVLADGTPFSFDLASVNLTDGDYFSPDALLTLTLIPEPTAAALAAAAFFGLLSRPRK